MHQLLLNSFKVEQLLTLVKPATYLHVEATRFKAAQALLTHSETGAGMGEEEIRFNLHLLWGWLTGSKASTAGFKSKLARSFKPAGYQTGLVGYARCCNGFF